jgi:DNA-binding GntR family transcriptional regulator
MSTSEIAIDALLQSVGDGMPANGLPKYQRLVEAFSECVISGRFKPGERVPTETSLAEKLPVSVGTVQKALARLVSNGLVVRNRRTGTFIADRRSLVNEVFVYRYKDPDTGKHMMPFVRTIAVNVDTSEGPWQEALAVKRCVRVDRLVWFDQQPPAFSSVFFTYEHGQVYLDQAVEDLNGSSLHRMLIERFNLPTVRMEHSIGCRTLDDLACQHLMLPEGTMGTVWDIKDFTIHDAPILFQRYQLPPGHRPVEITESYGS